MTAIIVLDNDMAMLFDDEFGNILNELAEFCVYIKDEEVLLVNKNARCINICDRRNIEL